MINGHGDDLSNYTQPVRLNMSSNTLSDVYNEDLYDYLADILQEVEHYPQADASTLEALLAKRHQISPSQVCATSGATEAIYLLALMFRRSRTMILQPTFSEYQDACRLHEHELLHTYTLPTPNALAGVDMLWICNPNNPTGSVLPQKELKELAEHCPHTTFVIDQSYEHFTLEPLFTAVEAAQLPNLLLLHSMTKQFCVPGLRLGYVTGSESLIGQLRRMRMPWSINQIAMKAGEWLVGHEPDYDFDLPHLLSERERVAQELQRSGIVEVWPSQSHILLCQLRFGNAPALKQWLMEEYGILIRDASNFPTLTQQYFRIAVQQSQEDNDLFLDAFRQWIEE